jgi:hypothetical protein
VKPLLTVTVPIKLVSEANGSHGHWSAKAGRAKSVRQAVTCAFIDHGAQVVAVVVQPKTAGAKVRRCARWRGAPTMPLVVVLARIAPRQLDDDNLARACKAARDQVAELLGVDDRDSRVRFAYEQYRRGVGEYGLEIRIFARGEVAP